MLLDDNDDEVYLHHLHYSDCTGLWVTGPVASGSTTQIIRCSQCKIIHPATDVNRLAAIDENYAGIYLRRLTEEGIALRKKEGSA